MKRIVVTIVRGLAGIAAVVFWLCPLRTGTQVLLFGASIIVFLICHAVLSNLDDDYIDKHLKDGYWPPANRHDASDNDTAGKTSG